MVQADHEVAYELRKAFEKFVELRKELRNRGFTVEHPYNVRTVPHYFEQDFDAIKINKTTLVTY